MSDEAQSPVEWLRAQVEADKASAGRATDGPWSMEGMSVLGRQRPYAAGPGDNVLVIKHTWPQEAEHIIRHDPRNAIADCEAKLAILDRCEPLLSDDNRKAEDYHDGRDDWEVERDEALADLAEDVLVLLADGYKHRPGWADHWACPGCGKAMHEVPDGHSWGIPLTGGPWTCSDPASPGGISPQEFAHPAGLAPGTRLTVHVAHDDTRFGEMPPPIGEGFTVDRDGDRWRTLVVSAEDDPDARQYTLELEVEGRYPEDERA